MPWSSPDYTDFPNNVVDALYQSYLTIEDMSAASVFRRPLRPTDPNVCIGVFADHWAPQQIEMGRTPDPAISRYNFIVHAFVKNGDEEQGLATHATLSKRVRTMVYRDSATRLLLQSLSVTGGDGVVERFLNVGVSTQRFMANEAPQGTFLYLSTMSLWLETETI